jgi:hypothetical protein
MTQKKELADYGIAMVVMVECHLRVCTGFAPIAPTKGINDIVHESCGKHHSGGWTPSPTQQIRPSSNY